MPGVTKLAVPVLALALAGAARAPANPPAFRVDHVVDGDTITLRNGSRVRLVQIDTPEVYFHAECYGRRASAVTKRLLRPGTLVRLLREPATDRVDRYGRLLRYVIRIHDGLDVNIRLVAMGAAAPYFYRHRRGRFAGEARASGETSACAQARALGALSRNPVRPVPRRLDRPAALVSEVSQPRPPGGTVSGYAVAQTSTRSTRSATDVVPRVPSEFRFGITSFGVNAWYGKTVDPLLSGDRIVNETTRRTRRPAAQLLPGSQPGARRFRVRR